MIVTKEDLLIATLVIEYLEYNIFDNIRNIYSTILAGVLDHVDDCIIYGMQIINENFKFLPSICRT